MTTADANSNARTTAAAYKGTSTMNYQPEGGYSSLFYLMLMLGIVGLLGVIAISAGSAGGW